MLRVPDHAKKYSWATGKLELWLAAPSVVVQCAHGRATREMSRPIIDNLDEVLARGVRPVIFNDWEELVGYTSETRIELTKWTADHVASLQQSHVLLRSKLVAMGVSVSNLVMGGIFTPHTDRRAFERELANAIRSSPAARP